jgi:hypothetical protein
MKDLKFKPTIDSILVHIPKTAGMTIYDSILDLELNFGWYLGSEYNENQDKSVREFKKSGSVTLGHIWYRSLLDANYLDKKYFKNSFKFCFVRNPYDRLVSLYKYHYINKRLNLNFDNFVKLLYDEFKNKTIPPIGLYNIKTFDKTSKLYHKHINANQYNQMIKWIPSSIGFIGRFEHLEADVNELIKILGYEGEPIHIPKLNYSKEDNFMSYYTNRQTIDYVSTIYKYDIRRFGYRFL